MYFLVYKKLIQFESQNKLLITKIIISSIEIAESVDQKFSMTSFQNIHLSELDKLSSPKLPTSNLIQTYQIIQPIPDPKCFYHNDKEISFFCQHPRCTLPLCEKCLPIHRMEHLSQKQIPMEKVVTYAQSKKFILQKLNQSKLKVTSNQKHFEKQFLNYKQKLIEIIERTLENLKEQLLIQDQQNSILKLKQVNQGIDSIKNQNSLSHVIKSYETYFQEIQLQKQSADTQNTEIRKNSIINHIKFVPDQKNLIQTIQRGFLHCKFIKHEQKIPAKINRSQYLKAQNQHSYNQRTPIHKLQSFIANSNNKTSQFHQNKKKQVPKTDETPILSFQMIQIKRKLRKSIFDQKENQPIEKKSLSFSNISKGSIKHNTKVDRQNQFSDVKKYNIDNSREQVILGKRKNIYTNESNHGLERSSDSSFIKRSSSNSSLRRIQKGITLTRQKPGVSDHYLMKKRESIDKMKLRLLNVSENDQASYDRSNSSDWKRVVTLSGSEVSVRNTSRERPNIYQLKAEPPQNKYSQFTNQTNLTSDILNPMEMRKLLMKKRNEKREDLNSIDAIQKEYQQKISNLRPYP